MKKLTIALSLALVFVLSMGAFAALNTNITGFVETDLTFRQEDTTKKDSPFKLFADTKTELTLSMSAGGGSGISASVGMSSATNKTGWKDWKSGLGNGGTGIPFNITSVQLKATGAYWKNGPALTTTAGTHAVSYSQYTAFGVGTTGVEISGAKVGPIDLKGYYGWETADETVLGVQATAKIDSVTVNGYLTNYGAAAADDRVTNFTVTGSATPVTGVTLDGVYSYDSPNEAPHYRVKATLKTIPNVTLTGRYQFTDKDFAPKYTETDTKKRNALYVKDEKVVEVTAATNQAGVDLSGSFLLKKLDSRDNFTETTTKATASTTIEGFTVSGTVTLNNKDDAGAKTDSTTTDLSVSKKFGNVNVKYTGKIFSTGADMQNTVTADTTVNTPIADNVKIEGIVRTGFVADKIEYGVDAAWKAPIGVDLRVGYSNFKWRKDGSYVNMGDPNGFFVRAYTKVSF